MESLVLRLDSGVIEVEVPDGFDGRRDHVRRRVAPVANLSEPRRGRVRVEPVESSPQGVCFELDRVSMVGAVSAPLTEQISGLAEASNVCTMLCRVESI